MESKPQKEKKKSCIEMKPLLLFIVILTGLLFVATRAEDEEAENGPIGMKFAVTQGGLAQILPQIHAKVLGSIRGMRIPDKSGKKGVAPFVMEGIGDFCAGPLSHRKMCCRRSRPCVY